MAANITGEFDVVAEFSVPAVDRVLAAMHRVERFPHSMTFRVDDQALPPGLQVAQPTVVGAVDAFGNAIANQEQIGKPNPYPGQLAAADPNRLLLDGIVNPDAGAVIGPVRPSNLQGRAQLQLAPPTIQIDDKTGTDVTVLIEIIARYFPDPNTAPLAEFMRGQLKVTAPVTQAAHTNPKVLDVDIKAAQASITFTPSWTSQPLSNQDLAAIDLAIRNALVTSFEPSSIPIPSAVNAMQFRALSGTQTAVAALLNLVTSSGNLSSFTTIFTQPNDDFAAAAGVDYVKAAFQPDLTPINWWVYTITPTSATVDLQEGKIIVTVPGNAVGHRWWTKNFSFTLQQNFTLQPASTTPGGPHNTLELVAGSISGGVTGWLANLFGASLLTPATQDAVHKLFSTDNNFGALFHSLLQRPTLFPIPVPFGPPPVNAALTYTSVEIHASGIVAHGSLSVSGWPPVYVELQEIPTTSATNIIAQRQDYSALNSWIPGGGILRYDLSAGGQVIDTETNKFILSQGPLTNAPAAAAVAATPSPGTALPGSALPGYVPLCLKVSGTRLSASGTVTEQNVSGTACGYGRFPIVSGVPSGPPALLALAQRGSAGQLVVAGHLSAQLAATGKGTPNRIVHFADDASAGNLQFLAQALTDSKRTDAPTAIVAVLSPDQFAKARYTDGVIYADNQNSAWEQVFGVKIAKRPLTLVVAPRGNIIWQSAGALDTAMLANVLNKTLVAGAPVKLGILRLTLRVGEPAPDFLFEYSPGRRLTLRKLAGAILIFWNSASQTSIQAVLDLQKSATASGASAPLVLAINDGDPSDVAKQVAAQNKFTAVVVTDPQREISFAYGVTIWPTIVTMGAAGVVNEIRYGYVPGQQQGSPFNGGDRKSRSRQVSLAQ